MDYSFEVSTPANTSKDDALETKLTLSAGLITEVWLYHPVGCHGFAHAVIEQGLNQLYPTDPEGSYAGNGSPITFTDRVELSVPAKLTLRTWNLDDTYDHKVYVRITIERVAADPVAGSLTRIETSLKKLFGRST